MNKRRSILSLLITAALAATACSVPNDKVTSGSSGDDAARTSCKESKVAYITPGLNIPFWRSLSVGIRRAAKEAGAEVVDFDSKLSQSTQLQNAQDAITSGADFIIISPTDSSSAPAVLDLAKKNNVPVVVADIGTDSGDYVTFVSTDNVGGAKAAGEYLVKFLSDKGITQGQIGIVGISQSRQNGKDRTKGFTDEVKSNGFETLSVLESKDYTRSEGLKLAQDLIAGNSGMVAMFTEHDEATLGALEAVKTTGSDTVIVGFDGSPDTVTAIKAGTVAGASMQQPVLMGRNAFEAACAYLDGNKPEKSIQVETILVTHENVDSIESQLEDTVFAEK